MSDKKVVGFQDRPFDPRDPLEEDSLGLDEYSKAISEFILQCPTPISIGIQGDWGSGKTSLMKMIQCNVEGGDQPTCEGIEGGVDGDRRRPDIECFWFNTWQYSQFDFGDQLPLIMISNLANKVAPGDDAEKRNLFNSIQDVADKGWRALKVFGKNYIADKAKTDRAAVDHALAEFDKQPQKDSSMVLEELTENFKKLCQEKLRGNATGKIVFFIDDLDRLLPEKAVELMEVMKNFLDVPGVVFVLACDYQVVEKGLGKKFGIAPEELDGRSFFDKIIQVPFRMPVSTYNVENYVRKMLNKVGWLFDETDDLDANHPDERLRNCTYQKILERSIGYNPRTIKRHFNTLMLIQLVLKNSAEEKRAILGDRHKLKLLFASICLEAAYPSFHMFFRKRFQQMGPETLNDLKGPGKELTEILDDDSTGKKRFRKERTNREQFLEFLEMYWQIIDKSGDGKISREELDDLKLILDVSSLASVQEAEVQGVQSSAVKHFVNYFVVNAMPTFAEIAQEILNHAKQVNSRRSRGYENRVEFTGPNDETFLLDYYRGNLWLMLWKWSKEDVEAAAAKIPDKLRGTRDGHISLKAGKDVNVQTFVEFAYKLMDHVFDE